MLRGTRARDYIRLRILIKRCNERSGANEMRGAASLVRKDDHTIRDTYIAVLLTLCEILVYLSPSLRRDSSEAAPSAAVLSAPSAGPLPSGDDSGVVSFVVDCSAMKKDREG